MTDDLVRNNDHTDGQAVEREVRGIDLVRMNDIGDCRCSACRGETA